jgi:hypothetical protein
MEGLDAVGNVQDVKDADGMDDVRVFIRPIVVERPGQEPATALGLAMEAAGVGCWIMERRSGVSHGTINNLVNNRGGVERKKADAISQALGLPTVRLFAHGDGVPPA